MDDIRLLKLLELKLNGYKTKIRDLETELAELKKEATSQEVVEKK